MLLKYPGDYSGLHMWRTLSHMSTSAHGLTPKATLDDLAGAFPGYRFWRSKDGAGEPASYCATRIQPLTAAEEMAGRARTLIAGTPGELRAQIEAQS